MRQPPEWWDWDLELSPHLLKRMPERGFTEIDVRAMLKRAVRVDRDVAPGRWKARTFWRNRRWVIILEPDPADLLLVVITAYRVDQ